VVQHTIRKQVLDLVVPSYSEAHSLTEKTQAIYYASIISVLDGVLSRFSDEYEVIHLDRVELDLGSIPYWELETQFVQRIRSRLEEVLANSIRRLRSKEEEQVQGRIFRRTDSKIDILMIFLETGCVPWWSSAAEKSDPETLFMGLLKSSPQEVAVMLRGLESHQAGVRIVKQFSVRLYQRLVEVFLPSEAVETANLLRSWISLLSSCLADVLTLRDVELHVRTHMINYLMRQQVHVFDHVAFNESLLEHLAIHTHLSSNAIIARLADQPDLKVMSSESGLHRWIEQFYPRADRRASRKPLHEKLIDDPMIGKTIRPRPQTAAETIDRGIFPAADTANVIRLYPPDDNVSTDAFKHPADGTENQQVPLCQETTDPTVRAGQDSATDSGKQPALTQRRMEPIDLGFSDPLTLQEGIYIENAGLVLIWSFLPDFFTKIKFVKNKSFQSEKYREHAVCLLQYLVTNETEWFESGLFLNKLLCGWPPFEPVNKSIDLSEAMLTESTELLNSVIAHWSALKNTSIDGLRRSFLQREGRLSKQDHGWQLKIDRKGYDVLLDKLPWGIGYIMLPWMDNPIWVEW
jgi:hypothetical protein